MSGWTADEMVQKLKEQAEENREHRHHLYEKVCVKTSQKILDIGCGTGVITEDIALLTKGTITGIDIDEKSLFLAQKQVSELGVNLVKADAMDLPFKNNTFDLVVFCGVLMYVKDKQKAVNEMARVTRKGGTVLATLEPDYGDVISYPEDPILAPVFESIKDMGADICTGRKLRSFFSNAGLQSEIGIFTGHLEDLSKSTTEQVDLFLKGFWFIEKALARKGWTQKQIKEYKKEYIQLIEDRTIFQFLPAFYAIGKKE
jgi:ubiquinone/menaquinone biosynthesis C-methylase UbiE